MIRVDLGVPQQRVGVGSDAVPVADAGGEANAGEELLEGRRPVWGAAILAAFVFDADGAEVHAPVAGVPGGVGLVDVLVDLAVSADATSQNRQRCLDLGCDAFLPKPIDQKRLIRTAIELLERSD